MLASFILSAAIEAAELTWFLILFLFLELSAIQPAPKASTAPPTTAFCVVVIFLNLSAAVLPYSITLLWMSFMPPLPEVACWLLRPCMLFWFWLFWLWLLLFEELPEDELLLLLLLLLCVALEGVVLALACPCVCAALLLDVVFVVLFLLASMRSVSFI